MAAFGEYIANRRKELGKSLRLLAEELGITAAYLSDIEKGRRNPPEINLLTKFFDVLKISPSDRDYLLDIVGKERQEISPDLPEYIMDVPAARTALRKARNMGESQEFWERVNDLLDDKDGKNE